MNNNTLLNVAGLKVHFPLKQSIIQTLTRQKRKFVRAVDGISFSIEKGKTLAVVGESGCGKTTLGRSLVNLYLPNEGKITYLDQDISGSEVWENNRLRKEIQYIFQNPYASLNPKMTILETVKQPLEIFNMYDKRDRRKRAIELLNMAGISSSLVNRFPHEFSGGQRQRVCIARALAVEPSMIIADEPTSALDVSIQCQILDLLSTLQKELGLTMLFISHDLGVVNYISDEVLVMYLGNIVEKGNTKKVFRNAVHPYTRALIEALPKRGSSSHTARVKLKGYIPSPINPPEGCLLHPRCPHAKEICVKERPIMQSIDGITNIACHFPLLEK